MNEFYEKKVVLWSYLWGRRTRKAESDLHKVINKPLQGSKGTDHDDPGSKTGPHSLESESLGRGSDGRSLRLVHVGHHGVSRMGYDSAEHWKTRANWMSHPSPMGS